MATVLVAFDLVICLLFLIASDCALRLVEKEEIAYHNDATQLTDFSVRITGRNSMPFMCCCKT
jgi:hypothetical protein